VNTFLTFAPIATDLSSTEIGKYDMERKLIRLATLIGAAIYLCRTVFSKAGRRKLDQATRALDNMDSP
jgi:hypothetical protein